MFLLTALATILFGYLSGSVNYAILITRRIGGLEIREIGNLNAGAANVRRMVGPGWGFLVGVLDVLKAVVPMWLVQSFVFTEAGFEHTVLAFAVGNAAIIGHCFPVFHGFRGGKGAAPYLGLLLYFVPGELAVTFVLATIVVALFVHDVEYRWSRWGPISAIILCPIVVGVAEGYGPVGMGLARLGGNGWGVVVGMIMTTVVMTFVNLSFMGDRVVELSDGQKQP